MKEKVFAYLQTKKGPVSVEELVREVLEIRQAGTDVSRQLIAALLKSDPRFRWDAGQTRVELADLEPSPLKESLTDTLWGMAHLSLMPTASGRIETAALAALRVRGGAIEDRICVWTAEGRQHAARELGLSAGELNESVSDRASLLRFCDFLHGAVWVSFEPRRDLAWLNGRLQAESLPALAPVALGLRALVRKLFPGETVRTIEEAAGHLGIAWTDASRPDLQARLAAEILWRSLDLVEEMQIATLPDLLALQERAADPIDWSQFQFASHSLAAIPKQPGVYFFTDRAETVIYVGKAKNLNSRVQSYFQSTGAEEEKKRALWQSAYNVAYEITGSELEALLREADAIRTLRPTINIQMEIHEPEREADRPGNRILILPSKEAAHVELFLIRRDKAVTQITAAQDLSGLRTVERRVQRFFFAKKKKSPPADETWKASLVWRWLKKHREQVLAIDPDRTADWAECARLLRRYIQEPVGSERIIHR